MLSRLNCIKRLQLSHKSGLISMILLGIEVNVQHSYRAEKDDELDLEEGDVVRVFESRKDGWLRGVNPGRSGWFPGSHIKGCTFDYKCTV